MYPLEARDQFVRRVFSSASTEVMMTSDRANTNKKLLEDVSIESGDV